MQPTIVGLQNSELRVQYLSYRPGPPLNEFVDYFWLIEGGQAPRLEKILPSGTQFHYEHQSPLASVA